MEPLTTTTHKKFIGSNSNPITEQVIIHTTTSCPLIDKVLLSLTGENISQAADLIVKMYNALVKAELFISGFEDDENQEGIKELLEQIREFDLK